MHMVGLFVIYEIASFWLFKKRFKTRWKLAISPFYKFTLGSMTRIELKNSCKSLDELSRMVLRYMERFSWARLSSDLSVTIVDSTNHYVIGKVYLGPYNETLERMTCAITLSTLKWNRIEQNFFRNCGLFIWYNVVSFRNSSGYH